LQFSAYNPILGNRTRHSILRREVASGPALALSLIRAGVRDSLHQTTRQAIDCTLVNSHRVFTGPDIEEGIKAFFDKRAPVFTSGRHGVRRQSTQEN
jgi:enoyl-CoA hydratase/carnithine racemase